MRLNKKFTEYIFDKNFAKGSQHLTQADYMQIQWMNVVPEIICDILGYLAGYVHFRTNFMSREAYESMLNGQV